MVSKHMTSINRLETHLELINADVFHFLLQMFCCIENVTIYFEAVVALRCTSLCREFPWHLDVLGLPRASWGFLGPPRTSRHTATCSSLCRTCALLTQDSQGMGMNASNQNITHRCSIGVCTWRDRQRPGTLVKFVRICFKFRLQTGSLPANPTLSATGCLATHLPQGLYHEIPQGHGPLPPSNSIQFRRVAAVCRKRPTCLSPKHLRGIFAIGKYQRSTSLSVCRFHFHNVFSNCEKAQHGTTLSSWSFQDEMFSISDQ